jgi:CspA family cold shock protein
MNKGKVKWFDKDKGYGFIEPENKRGDIFVHISEVERLGVTTLENDQNISYDTQEKRDGKSSAVNLQLL